MPNNRWRHHNSNRPKHLLNCLPADLLSDLAKELWQKCWPEMLAMRGLKPM